MHQKILSLCSALVCLFASGCSTAPSARNSSLAPEPTILYAISAAEAKQMAVTFANESSQIYGWLTYTSTASSKETLAMSSTIVNGDILIFARKKYAEIRINEIVRFERKEQNGGFLTLIYRLVQRMSLGFLASADSPKDPESGVVTPKNYTDSLIGIVRVP